MNKDVREDCPQVGARYLQTEPSSHRDGRIPRAVGKTLLIVDDEPMLTELLRNLVEEAHGIGR